MLFLSAQDTNVSVLVVSLLVGGILNYVIYQQWLHPLSRFPGPFWASLTDVWKVQILRTGTMPAQIRSLHERYGDVVRIGPNELSFNHASAVDEIYKVGRAMEKGPLYEGFTSFKPNVFGLRDEDKHARRRRQMAHGFSNTALRTMEAIFDEHVANLCRRLDEYSTSQKAFDLKDMVTRYQYDLMGHLAFNRSFDTQLATDAKVPEWNDHFYLGCIYGMMPSLLPYSMRMGNYLPLKWFQNLVQSRAQMRQQTIDSVTRSIESSDEARDRSLLRYVIEARDPDSGERLSQLDICTEAFGFLVAGSHTTSSSITLLISHLLDNPPIMKNLVRELDDVLPPLTDTKSYEFSGLEAKLPYTQACVRESLRISPVVSIPLSRRVTPTTGLTIGGHLLRSGTLVSSTSTCLHHKTAIFGPEPNVFEPRRWLGEDPPDEKMLFHFGNGHRQCMGKNLATMSIWKMATMVLKQYAFELVDGTQKTEYQSKGLTERRGPLFVTVKKRA